ncbi:hypothetical protein ANN_16919 [Periplaneta americana]|uniref:Uncharacterized protein n=1 Tax=Periplaneta americana TaxID=6978 RepID=A0ABQ8SSW5_PERAM|nr:hypothetical protein ANN_16919 [Periplaneta americana]
MAGLCEGGNEPSGSLKAICNWVERKCISDFVIKKLRKNVALSLIDEVKVIEENEKRRLEEAKKLLELEIAQLKEKLQEVTNEKIQLDSQNKILGSNISSLYKTATAEIERKDRMIADLRKEKDSILFRRKTKKTATAKKESVPVPVPETTDNNWNSEEVDVPVVENDNSEPYYDYPIDVDYEERDFNNYYSNNTSTHAEQPPQEMETIFSKRQKLRLAAENTPPVNPVTSKEEQNSDVPWCLIPLQETETTAKSSHHRNAYVSKDRSPVLQTESRKELEYSSHNRSRRETKTDDKYDGIHDRTRKSVTDSSRSSSTTLKDSVSRHSRYRDEYKSYSKYKSEKYSRSDDRSRKYSSSSYSRWGTHRPPRSMREASVSRALRSLRSRSVSQCRSKVKSVIVTERKTSEVKYSAIADASSHSKSSSKPDTTKPGMKKQTQNEVQNKNSENQTCKTKDKDGNDVNSGPKHSNAELPSTEIKSSFNLPVNNSEPEMQLLSSFEDSSKINSSENGTELQVNSTSKIMKDQTKIDDCKDKSVARLSEHFSFKRSGRTKIVKLNNEKSLGEAMKSALKSNILENEKSELTHVPDQKRGTKRSYENEDENDVQFPLFKRKALDDITRKECYNNTDDIVTYSKPNNDRIKQANTDLARENSMKNEKCSDESASLKDMDISEMKTIDETKERKDQEDEYMVLDIEEGELCDEDDIDKRRTEIKEILSKKDSKSGDTRLETRDKNIEKRKDNGSHHGDRSKLRSERRFSDSKRKTAGSSRSEYSAKRGYERSRTPFRFNNHCKRRSPSELLTGNRSGRMSRDRDIRSRSFEDVSKTYRGPERHNIIDNLEGKGKKHEDKRGSSEEKKREKSSKDEPKKLSSNQRDVEKMEKHEYNTENVQEKGDSLKIGKKNHKEESQTRKDDSSRKHDDSHDKIKPLEKSVKRGNKKCTDKEVLLPGTEPMITDKVIKTLESRDSTKSNPCGNKSNNETSRSRNSTCEDENVHVEMKKNNGAYYSLEDGHATTSELLENTFLGSENENCNKSDKSLSKIEEIKSTSTKDNKTHIEEDGDHRNVEKICVEEEKEDNSVTYNSISRTETSSINEPSDSIQRKSSKQLDTDVTRRSTSEKNPKTLPPDLNNITEITRNRKEDKVSKSRSCESRSDYVHEKEDEELQQKVSKELNIEQTESSVTVRSENKKREMTKIKEGDDFKQKHEHISRNEITDDRPLSHSKQELETKERHGSKREKNQETNVQDKENEESQQMCKQLISEQIEPVETVESENKKRKTAETIEVVQNFKQKHEHTSRSETVEDRPLSRSIQYDPIDSSKTELETKERYRSKREKNQKSNVQDKENEESQEMCKQLITEQTKSSETVNSENKKRETAETNEVIHDFKQKHEHASRSEITEDRPLSRSKQYDPIDSFKIEPETNERHRSKREKTKIVMFRIRKMNHSRFANS